MSLILRGNTWHIRKVINGITIAESTKTGNKRLAEQIAAKRISEVTQEVVLAGNKPVKLHEAIDQFVKSRQHMPSHQNCEIHIRYFKELPNVYLNKVTDAEIDELISKKRAEGYAESTLVVSKSYFNAMLKHCADKGHTARKKIKIKKPAAGKLRWLTRDELQRLFAALDPEATTDEVTRAQKQENYDLARMLADTGARYSEIAEMTWNQVDLMAKTVYIQRKKGSVSGTIGMTQTMQEILTRRRQMERGDYVFGSKALGPEGDARLNNESGWMKRAVKRAGLSEVEGTVTLHTLRHTCAVHLLQGGMNLLEVQKFLGHKTIQSTMVYVHVIQEDVTRKATSVLDLRQELLDAA